MSGSALGLGRRASATARPALAAIAGVLAALVLGAVVAVGLERYGVFVVVLPLVALGMAALALVPKFTLWALAVLSVALEDDPEAFLSQLDTFYVTLPGGLLESSDLLVLAVVAGTALKVARSGRPPVLPGPFTLPLALLTVAIGIGLVMGLTSGAMDPGAAFASTRKLLYLILLPILAVNLLDRRRDLVIGIGLLVAVVVYKSFTGALGLILGIGREIDGSVLTYYAPAANFVLLVFVIAVLIAALMPLRLPTWVWVLWPVAAAILILALRRNFWIALVVCAILAVLVLTGRHGRGLIVPATASLLVAFTLGLGAVGGSQNDSPIVERVQSLSPDRIDSGAYGRYRLDEQRNVRSEIARQPVVGLGLGVPWQVRHPLPVTFPEGQQYTHITALWYWLKLGLMGLLAYIAVVVASCVAGARLWRGSAPAHVRLAGLALSISFVGLAVAETTGSFLGVESRTTTVAALMFGWLAAALRLYPPASSTPTPAPAPR